MIISKFELFVITVIWLCISILSFYLGYQKGKYDIELSQISKLIENAPLKVRGTISDLINDWRGLNPLKGECDEKIIDYPIICSLLVQRSYTLLDY